MQVAVMPWRYVAEIDTTNLLHNAAKERFGLTLNAYFLQVTYIKGRLLIINALKNPMIT